MSSHALLLLEDGTAMSGQPYGAVGQTIGEAVFCTAMTGYQETLTDPSYHRQVVIMTAPHIGNTGVNAEDDESERMWVSGFVVRDPARRVSNWRATGDLESRLQHEGVVGISGVDTRALTRRIREHGAMRVGVFSGDAATRPVAELLAQVQSAPKMTGASLVDDVTVAAPHIVEAAVEHRATVAALDLGIKSMTPEMLAQRGARVHVLPASTTWDDIQALNVDGLFVSNGPGDPATMTRQVDLVRTALEHKLPFFGICFGHQMFGQALGLETYKLTYGHRGINQPVLDTATGRVQITAQNHGFAVKAPEGVFDTPYGRAEVSHWSLNDRVVEGLRCLDVPAFSVQFHPEAAAGPHDAAELFDQFVSMMGGQHASA